MGLWQRLLGVASVRVWHLTSRRWGPWTERPLPEVVRVAYPRGDVETKETLRFDVAKKTVEIANRAKEQH